MYKIILTNRFKKSLRKIKKSNKHNLSDIQKLINDITHNKKLDIKFKDHKLHRKLSQLRECHIKPNLLLVYEKDKEKLILVLVDIESHNELFK
ncbi:MAG TPA: type II toxin-antitoxin system YafQ family toxin [Candidatus Kaiserbacteria bacterium]|nr:type II toxin-antitoxin system YafQ family toxin [Candidatus Kaiserbacteria bacterium]